MEQEKQQTLSNLYALRAGLSVISQENDEVDKKSIVYGNELSNHIRSFDDICNFFPRRETIDNDNTREEYKTRYKTQIMAEDYEKVLLDNIKRSMVQEKRYSHNHNVSLVFFLGLILALLGGTVASLYFAVKYFIADEGWAWLGVLGTLIGGGLTIFLGTIIADVGLYWSKERSFDAEYKQIECLPQLKKTLFETEKKYKEEIKNIKSGCEELYIALQKEFGKVLDVRDWENLDLVIYYYETRRADSVKEALQLVDRELQTQRIQQTIVDATNQICETLAAGFVMLQNTMVNCFDALSTQMANSTAVISAQLGSLTSAVNMNNALKAKANVTSQELMRDVRDIRNFVCN